MAHYPTSEAKEKKLNIFQGIQNSTDTNNILFLKSQVNYYDLIIRRVTLYALLHLCQGARGTDVHTPPTTPQIKL